MDAPSYEELLRRMPAIANAVNGFQSQDVQAKAFDLLTQDLVSTTSSVLSKERQRAQPSATHTQRDLPSTKPDGEQVGHRRGRTRKTYSAAKDLDFRPSGKTSLADFVGAKKPNGSYEQNTVAMYYVKEVLGLEHAGLAQVLSCFRECGWPPPKNPDNSLAKTASVKGWLDTADLNDIKLTPAGIHMVEQELPRKP